jgi:hypothetical protein
MAQAGSCSSIKRQLSSRLNLVSVVSQQAPRRPSSTHHSYLCLHASRLTTKFCLHCRYTSKATCQPTAAQYPCRSSHPRTKKRYHPLQGLRGLDTSQGLSAYRPPSRYLVTTRRAAHLALPKEIRKKKVDRLLEGFITNRPSLFSQHLLTRPLWLLHTYPHCLAFACIHTSSPTHLVARSSLSCSPSATHARTPIRGHTEALSCSSKRNLTSLRRRARPGHQNASAT